MNSWCDVEGFWSMLHKWGWHMAVIIYLLTGPKSIQVRFSLERWLDLPTWLLLFFVWIWYFGFYHTRLDKMPIFDSQSSEIVYGPDF